MPTSYSSVIVSYNKPLENKKNQKNLKISINSTSKEWNYSIKNNQLIITFDTTFKKGDQFTINIKNISSKNSEFSNFNRNYSVQYVDPDKLPKDDLKRLTEQSDSFEKQHPLVKYLPIEDTTYSVEYQYPDSAGDRRMPIIISSTFNLTTNSPDGIPTQSDIDDYLEGLRKSRTKAINRIKALGYSEKKYQLYFNEPYITDEFGGKYIGDKSN